MVPTLRVSDFYGDRTVNLDCDLHVIGRSEKCSIQVSCEYASRLHATVFRAEDGAIFIADGYKGRPSTNGIMVNGKSVDVAELKSGDVIYLGGTDTRLIYLEEQPGMCDRSEMYDTFVGAAR